MADGSDWDPRFYLRSGLFAPIAERASLFSGFASWPEVAAYDALLSDFAGVHFRLQPPKGRRARRRDGIDVGSLYDARISEGWVPTRQGNWHDFLNALVWATFPESKRVFHARQERTVRSRLDPSMRVLPSMRTREQDGLAILDEGSLLLLVNPSSVDAIRGAHEARQIEPVAEAIRRDDAAAIAFGHALYESLVCFPERLIWAMVVLLPCPSALPSSFSERVLLADQLLAERVLSPSSFSDPTQFRSLPFDERLCSKGLS